MVIKDMNVSQENADELNQLVEKPYSVDMKLHIAFLLGRISILQEEMEKVRTKPNREASHISSDPGASLFSSFVESPSVCTSSSATSHGDSVEPLDPCSGSTPLKNTRISDINMILCGHHTYNHFCPRCRQTRSTAQNRILEKPPVLACKKCGVMIEGKYSHNSDDSMMAMLEYLWK